MTPEAQLGTGLQARQVSGGPATLYRPAAQLVHCELPGPAQVKPEAQPAMGEQALHTRSVVVVQAVTSWVPGPQGAVQVAHTSAVPSTRWEPPAQVVHC